jgi:glycosyltransferase involved in cell wall biosynthesis
MVDSLRILNVMFVSSGGGFGGGDRYLYYLLKNINRRKFNPSVAYYIQNSGPDAIRIRNMGVPVFFLKRNPNPDGSPSPPQIMPDNNVTPQPNKIRALFKFLMQFLFVEAPRIMQLVRIIKKQSIDLVVLNNDVSCHIAGALSAKLAGVHCLCRKAGEIGGSTFVKRLLNPCVDLYIAVSRATEQDQISNNPFRRKVIIVNEGVDLELFKPSAHVAEKHSLKRQLGIPNDWKVVGNVSRFAKGKGQMEFLEAASRIRKDCPAVAFLLVGYGEMMQSLKQRAAELNLEECVRFTGWRTDTPELLSIMDIFVHCPTTSMEAMGIANLEAMAMEKPVLVSQNAGLTDVVVNGISGFIVPVGDISKIGELVLKLLGDAKLSSELGKQARKRVESRFDAAKNTRIMELLFTECVRSSADFSFDDYRVPFIETGDCPTMNEAEQLR